MKTQTVHLFKWQGGLNWGVVTVPAVNCVIQLSSHATSPMFLSSHSRGSTQKYYTNDAYLASNINLCHLGLFAFDYVTTVLALYTTLR
jgi:uncharacterized membrane protein YuzA (DUF378 family)